MAPPYRITAKLYPLLNSKYLKCSVNISRFRSKKSVIRELKSNMEQSGLISEEREFHEMIHCRQSEAKKTVIVQLNKFNDAVECTEYLKTFGRLDCVYHYTTKMSHPNMLLVQFKMKDDIRRLLNAVKYLDTSAYIGVPTMIMKYQSSGIQRILPSNVNQTNFRKYSHHFPTWVMVKSNLLYSKSISEQMMILCKTVKLSDIDIRLRFFTAHQLCLSFGRLFPTISILPFGSSISGFGQLGCDLDIVCTVTQNSDSVNNNSNTKLLYCSKPFSAIERVEQQEFLKPLAMLLNKFIPGVTNTQSILKARVPIIKFSNNLTSMHCDLSSNNLSGFYMSEILYTYGIMDERVKPLVFTLRKWAYTNGITAEVAGPRLTNFCLTLLIVFYLQVEKILPPMNKMLLSSNEIGETEFCRYMKSVVRRNIVHKCSNKSTLEELLFGFFEFYATFDFKMFAICVRDGKTKTKPDLSPVYLFNPLDPLLNVSRNVSTIELNLFVQRSIHTLNMFNNNKINSIIHLIEQSNMRNNYERQMEEVREHDIEKDIDMDEPNKIEKIIK